MPMTKLMVNMVKLTSVQKNTGKHVLQLWHHVQSSATWTEPGITCP